MIKCRVQRGKTVYQDITYCKPYTYTEDKQCREADQIHIPFVSSYHGLDYYFYF